MRKAKALKSEAMKLMEQLSGGPLTLGLALESLRKGESLSQEACAKRLRISKSHLCDVEKGRKLVSPSEPPSGLDYWVTRSPCWCGWRSRPNWTPRGSSTLL